MIHLTHRCVRNVHLILIMITRETRVSLVQVIVSLRALDSAALVTV